MAVEREAAQEPYPMFEQRGRCPQVDDEPLAVAVSRLGRLGDAEMVAHPATAYAFGHASAIVPVTT